VSLRVINDGAGAGTQHGANVHACASSAFVPGGDYGGAFQVDDPVSGGAGCRAPNPFTGTCACAPGTDPIELRTIVDVPGGGFIGSNVSFCARAGASGTFGGVYQMDDAVKGGLPCRVSNTLTNACSCPSGMHPQVLRVEVDSSEGFIGSHFFVCGNNR
jgi:hypothetical protein